jgi:hypothetical protein
LGGGAGWVSAVFGGGAGWVSAVFGGTVAGRRGFGRGVDATAAASPVAAAGASGSALATLDAAGCALGIAAALALCSGAGAAEASRAAVRLDAITTKTAAAASRTNAATPTAATSFHGPAEGLAGRAATEAPATVEPAADGPPAARTSSRTAATGASIGSPATPSARPSSLTASLARANRCAGSGCVARANQASNAGQSDRPLRAALAVALSCGPAVALDANANTFSVCSDSSCQYGSPTSSVYAIIPSE